MPKKNEFACDNPKGECGKCGIPNPMNTDTEGKAKLGRAITQFANFQKSLVKRFGSKEAEEKAKCEFNRITKILTEQYHVDTSNYKPFAWHPRSLKK